MLEGPVPPRLSRISINLGHAIFLQELAELEIELAVVETAIRKKIRSEILAVIASAHVNIWNHILSIKNEKIRIGNLYFKKEESDKFTLELSELRCIDDLPRRKMTDSIKVIEKMKGNIQKMLNIVLICGARLSETIGPVVTEEKPLSSVFREPTS